MYKDQKIVWPRGWYKENKDECKDVIFKVWWTEYDTRGKNKVCYRIYVMGYKDRIQWVLYRGCDYTEARWDAAECEVLEDDAVKYGAK